MTVPSELAARRQVEDAPSWADLQAHANSDDPRLRQEARDAVARIPDLPDCIHRVLTEVCLDDTGRATSWTTRFHRLRPHGHATRFVADVLQQAASTPVPYLLDLLARPGDDALAADCLTHRDRSVRAVAREVVSRSPSK